LLAGIRQQGPQDAHAVYCGFRGHTGQPGQPGAAQKMEQERFRLIVPVMGQDEGVGLRFRHCLPEEAVACLPRPAFARIFRRNGTVHQQRNMQVFAQFAHEGFVAVGGVAPQAMIHMDGIYLAACVHQQMHKCYAVRAARQPDKQLSGPVCQLIHHPEWARRSGCRGSAHYREPDPGEYT